MFYIGPNSKKVIKHGCIWALGINIFLTMWTGAGIKGFLWGGLAILMPLLIVIICAISAENDNS